MAGEWQSRILPEDAVPRRQSARAIPNALAFAECGRAIAIQGNMRKKGRLDWVYKIHKWFIVNVL
jgi:hypothetical protein